MRALIFANGVLNPPPGLPSAEVIIAADGGGRHCQALGITPHIVIGDFDSLSEADLAAFQSAGAQVIRYPAAKDYTDLELAVHQAQELGVDEILLLGALGARWDQTLANLLLPALGDFSATHIRLIDGDQEISYLRGGETITLHGHPGDTISLIPLAGPATGITTQGLEYPLQDEDLHFGSTRGVSNVLLDQEARISLQDGLLLCLVIHATN